ncbi:MAG: MFS transporter [Candidatus Hodarchaeota archaeon]
MKEEERFTPDFKAMIRIVIWNSLGFIFVEFIMIYVASQTLGASGTQIGLVFSLLTIGSLISSFVVGYFTDRISKKFLIMLGSFGRGISYFSFYAAVILKSLPGVYISCFLLGLGAGIFWVPFDTLISDKSSKYYRSSAFGQRRFAMGIGMIGGAIVGFLIFGVTIVLFPENSFIVYSAFPLFGIANFYAGIQFSRKVDESSKFIHIEKRSIEIENNKEDLTQNSSLKLIMIGMSLLFITLFLANINAGIYRPFIQPFILENIESNPALVSWIYIPTTVIGTLFAPKLGILADKVNVYIIITISSILGGITTWFVIISKDLWIFTFLLIIDNVIALFSSFALINFLSRISKKHRGKIFGSLTSFEQLGFSLGPILGGYVWDTIGQIAPFLISIIVEWSLIPFFIFGFWILSPHVDEPV